MDRHKQTYAYSQTKDKQTVIIKLIECV